MMKTAPAMRSVRFFPSAVCALMNVMWIRCILVTTCWCIMFMYATAQLADNSGPYSRDGIYSAAATAYYQRKSATVTIHEHRWQPESQGAVGTRQEWMRYHGMRKPVFDELKSKVIRCKTLMLQNANIKVDQSFLDKMDEFLLGGLLSIEQVDRLIESETRRQKRKMLNYKNDPNAKWTFPIRYKYDGSHDLQDIEMIEHAIHHWQKDTCLTFKRYKNTAKLPMQHLLFTNEPKGCWSYVAKVPKNESYPQQINLQSSRRGIGGCTDMLGTPVHEIGHALGCWHEHVRKDRDKYVLFHKTNVLVEKYDNFRIIDKLQINTLGIPYDLGSVMHYSRNEMSTHGRHALTTLNRLYRGVIGQRVGTSFFDLQLVNKVYCSGYCGGRCSNKGYRNPTKCSRCICPEGFGGRRCQTVAPGKGICWPSNSAEIKVLSTDRRHVETRDYQIGGNYQHGDRCNWLLKAPVGCKISVQFEGDFGLYCDVDTKTCLQWVEIKYTKDLTLRGPRFCCGAKPVFPGNGKLTSHGNRMLVVFDARYPLSSNVYSKRFSQSMQRGFRLIYAIADASCLPAGTKTSTVFFSNPKVPKLPKFRTRPCKPYPYCKCKYWAAWSSWSQCTRACSGCGAQLRFRKCILPRTMIQTQKRTCEIKKCTTYVIQYRRLIDQFYKYQTVPDCCYNFKLAISKKLPIPIRCALVS